ncbi:MAG: LysE family translocator [Lautropia sp.]
MATQWLAFAAVSVVLAVTPGPAVVYIVARTLAQGRRSGLTSVAAVALGNFGNAAGAALGLAALFAVSSLAFTVVKYAGAAYLIHLGFRALRSPAAATATATATAAGGAAAPAAIVGDAAIRSDSLGRVFRDGALVALLNPKTALFFAALLPQFIDPAGPATLQSLALGALFVVIAAGSDIVYVLAAGLIGPRLARAGRVARAGRYATASVYFGLGAYTALSDSRPGAAG